MINNCRISMNVELVKKSWFLVKKLIFGNFICASSLAIPKVLSKQLYTLFCTYICLSRFYRNNDCQSSFITKKSATILLEKLKMGLKGPKTRIIIKGGTKRFSFFALFNMRTPPRLYFSLKLPNFGLKMIVYLSSLKWWKNNFWKISQFRGIPQNVGQLFSESLLTTNLISPSFFKIFPKTFFLLEKKN